MHDASLNLRPFAPVALDPRPARWRIGLIALATDHTSERDFAAMSPSREVAIYVSRVPFANPTSRETYLAMQPHLRDAADLLLPGETLDAVCYGCTAASAEMGDRTVSETIRAAKPGVPVVTPTSAVLAACGILGLERISLLTPYTEVITERLAAYLRDAGLDIVGATYLGLDDDREIARVCPETIIAAAAAAHHPDAQGLFIACTALRAAAVVSTVEDRLGLPVVSSVQAMFWRSLRSAGCDLNTSGYGHLLSRF